MQMFAIDSFYLCVMAAAELAEPNHCPAAPAGPSPAWLRRVLRRPHLRTAAALTQIVCAMMQWDSFYIESAHF